MKVRLETLMRVFCPLVVLALVTFVVSSCIPRPHAIGVVNMTLLGAFLLGLAHTIEPCEDKAVVSLIAVWAGERLKSGIALVILYGLSMCLINAVFGATAALIGMTLLKQYEPTLKIIAGAITILFGLLMLSGRRVHIFAPSKGFSFKEGSVKDVSPWSVFLMGVGRGLPFCPFELTVLAWAASAGSVWRGALMVFVFGLGTTIGLIPWALVMGGLGGLASKTKYSAWVPRMCGFLMIVLGAFVALSAWI